MYLLAGDIGGTKTHLALFESGNKLKIIEEDIFKSDEYSSLNAVVKKFLSNKKYPISKACFGVAGPVRKGRCYTTNLPWIIDSTELKEQLGVPVHLLNDLEAMAYGIPELQENEVFVLNKGNIVEGNQALLAAGTGLGEAGIFWDGKQHKPFACEGGHTDFAPRDEMESMLFLHMQRKFGHVSYERIVSGPGLYSLYQFLVESKIEERIPFLEEEFKKQDPSKIISEKAINGEIKGCIRALEWFISFYGAEAGNAALKFFALSGVFIGGGIAPKILDKMKEGKFMQAFIDKGRFSSLMSSIPVKVILNQKTPLLGAAHFANVSS
jgi:glucokinase